MKTISITANIYQNMILSAAAYLSDHVDELNDLNVFPIPDGDTGSNMYMTLSGGKEKVIQNPKILSETASCISEGMLMGARGNSGVILSQFFAGISDGLGGLKSASIDDLVLSFESGVRRAYSAVLTPVEGTILTVMREATEGAKKAKCKTAEEFFLSFITNARTILDKTPDLLIDLKKAGVVDSGGAGLVCIAEGMYKYLQDGKVYESGSVKREEKVSSINIDAFTSDSALEFGYCTEVMLRLQSGKVGDVNSFDESVIKDYLLSIGSSIVCFKTGSVVKVHVHTFTPYKVLEYLQKYGEYLTVKIENMNLQHNEVMEKDTFALKREVKKERSKYAVVSCAIGEGIISQFREFGSYVIEGGQTQNPSTDDFIKAFDEVNSDYIFVLPCNGNVLLTARLASSMYKSSDVRVLNAKTLGDGYAALSMLDYTSDNPDEIESLLSESMSGVETGEVSVAIRDTSTVKKGEYLGLFDKDIVSSSKSVVESTLSMIDKMSIPSHDLLVLISGKNATEEERKEIEDGIKKKYPRIEVYTLSGKQEVYDYIVVVE